jgi:hypothetical protein
MSGKDTVMNAARSGNIAVVENYIGKENIAEAIAVHRIHPIRVDPRTTAQRAGADVAIIVTVREETAVCEMMQEDKMHHILLGMRISCQAMPANGTTSTVKQTIRE